MDFQLPSWYFGELSRTEAEQLLIKDGSTDGLFLFRESRSAECYVLSMCFKKKFEHYQIKPVEVDGDTVLTFETDTGVAPHLRSLSAVFHYLLRKPKHLPCPLQKWVECSSPVTVDTSSDDLPSVMRPASGNASPATPRAVAPAPPSQGEEQQSTQGTQSAKDHLAVPGDAERLYEAPRLTRARNLSLRVASSLEVFVKDTLSSAHPTLSCTALSHGSFYETLTHYQPSVASSRFKVVGSAGGKLTATECMTGESVPIKAGDEFELITMERAKDGTDFFVVKDTRNRSMRIPRSSAMKVVPASISQYQQPPPVPKRESKTLSASLSSSSLEGVCQSPSSTAQQDAMYEAVEDIPEEIIEDSDDGAGDDYPGSEGVHHPQPLRLYRQTSLATVVSKSGLVLPRVEPEHSLFFFRHVIKEGYLDKLPPAGNLFQVWRRRYFRLVIALNRRVAGGPVYLEYYATHKATIPKGVIDLNNTRAVSAPPPNVIRDVKPYRDVTPECLFEVDKPRRLYRLLASSESESKDWIGTLREVLGMDDESVLSPALSTQYKSVFSGLLLNKSAKNSEGQIILSRDVIALRDPATGIEVACWHHQFLRTFGYIRNICWFEIGNSFYGGDGIVCLATPEAEDMFQALNHFVERSTQAKQRRLSRRHNMSWTSISELETIKAEPKTLFGVVIPSDDLQPIGIAVSNEDFQVDGLALHRGQSVRVLASKAFQAKGMLLVHQPGSEQYALVPEDKVEIHDYDFQTAMPPPSPSALAVDDTYDMP
eukprot:m.16930 g.16930  ORF g.16930 m.16930 type:complete len:767 (+) comp7278_c0_seq1:79-2379(+)